MRAARSGTGAGKPVGVDAHPAADTKKLRVRATLNLWRFRSFITSHKHVASPQWRIPHYGGKVRDTHGKMNALLLSVMTSRIPAAPREDTCNTTLTSSGANLECRPDWRGEHDRCETELETLRPPLPFLPQSVLPDLSASQHLPTTRQGYWITEETKASAEIADSNPALPSGHQRIQKPGSWH